MAPLTQVCTHTGRPRLARGAGASAPGPRARPAIARVRANLVADSAIYELAERILPALAATHPDAAEALAEQRLLRGRVSEVPALLAGRGDPEALALHGWLRFLQGDYAEAIDRFEAAQLLIRKLTRKRNVFLPGLPGVLYLAALLRRGGRADFEQVQKQLVICLRADVSAPMATASRVLGDVAEVLAGQLRMDHSVWLRHRMTPYGAFPLLFQTLAQHWLGRPPDPDTLSALAANAAKAALAGLDWYAHEAVAVLHARGYQGEVPTLGEPPPGLVLMAGLLAPKPAWEIALDALKGLGTQPVAGGPGS